jgi:hypothetical protein
VAQQQQQEQQQAPHHHPPLLELLPLHLLWARPLVLMLVRLVLLLQQLHLVLLPLKLLLVLRHQTRRKTAASYLQQQHLLVPSLLAPVAFPAAAAAAVRVCLLVPSWLAPAAVACCRNAWAAVHWPSPWVPHPL